MPAPSGLAENEGFADIFAQSIGDALELIPRGVSPTPSLRANTAFRSADRAYPCSERRSLSVLRDGVPASHASVATEYREVDPLTVRYIEVFSG